VSLYELLNLRPGDKGLRCGDEVDTPLSEDLYKDAHHFHDLHYCSVRPLDLIDFTQNL